MPAGAALGRVLLGINLEGTVLPSMMERQGTFVYASPCAAWAGAACLPQVQGKLRCNSCPQAVEFAQPLLYSHCLRTQEDPACPCSLPEPLWGSVSLRLSCCWRAELLPARQSTLHLPSKQLQGMQGSDKPAVIAAHAIAVSAHAASLGPLQGSYSLASHEQRDTVFVRGYVNGKLEREEVVTAEERDAVFGPLEKRQERKNRRRHRTARVRHAPCRLQYSIWYVTVEFHEQRLCWLPQLCRLSQHRNTGESHCFPGHPPLVQLLADNLTLVLQPLPTHLTTASCIAAVKECHADTSSTLTQWEQKAQLDAVRCQVSSSQAVSIAALPFDG